MWTNIPLEYATERFISGGTPSTSNPSFWGGEIPWITGADFNDDGVSLGRRFISKDALINTATNLVPKGSVLLVTRTGVGKIAIATQDTAISQDITGIIQKSGFDAQFILYAIRSSNGNLISAQRGATIKGVTRDVVKKLPIPFIAISEQRRIVEILDEADRLRRLRHEADAKATRILPALFLKMFGDPATNPKGWAEKPLREAIAIVDAGWSATNEARLRQKHEFGVLKVSAVTSGRFLAEEHKAVIDIPETRTLVRPRRGDLLFSRANTRELVAASCIVDADHPNLFLSDKLWRLTPRDGIASTLFLKELFWNDGIRDRFRVASSGSSGSMLNISQEAMLRTVVPMPPYELQMKFEAIAWRLIEITNQARNTASKIDSIWETLMQRAFSGQLTAKWREAHSKELLAGMEQQARLLNLPLPKEMELAP